MFCSQALTPCAPGGSPKPNNECCATCACVDSCMTPQVACAQGESPTPHGECCPICLAP
jgi:hypothetical protein